ncbi:ABC transporter permease [Dyella mobilis]|uniref:ABC transporter permease n=1 Tax=Dyella mobilis TaxID=1849582 RepID=A0ABS2KHH1_9GAMM|nr:ABC transporter permease [Dyella mobilis]MBM7130345.1 ABC transporter permease [Dyella mobilis]GLQ96971.1 ABC transporter ATP-binding protein [Dyella mobilis]
MFGYYLDLAWRSLRRTPVMTALMVLAIGLGIGASMTMLTVLHVMSDDPLPDRSAHLFVPHLDPRPANFTQNLYAPDASANFTYPDAMALVSSRQAVRQAAMAGGTLLARRSGTGHTPFYADGRFTTPDFFAMFDLSFLSGSAWSQADEDARARVVVLSESLSREVFGTADSVGRIAHLNDADLRVVGVTRDWQPNPMFYADADAKEFSDADRFFLPLSTSLDLKFNTNGNQSSWAGSIEHNSPTLTWLQVWVQLDTASEVTAYRRYLADYAGQQKKLGRYERSADSAHLYSLMEWLAIERKVPSDIHLQVWLALAFLAVCITNIVALLLAKFLRRGGEISVRRAMGARRRDIFIQLATESAVIGFAGGVLGLILAQLGLWSVRHRPDDYAHLASMDGPMLAFTFALALGASLLAGLLPAWRACRITPALQLKTQ